MSTKEIIQHQSLKKLCGRTKFRLLCPGNNIKLNPIVSGQQHDLVTTPEKTAGQKNIFPGCPLMSATRFCMPGLCFLGKWSWMIPHGLIITLNLGALLLQREDKRNQTRLCSRGAWVRRVRAARRKNTVRYSVPVVDTGRKPIVSLLLRRRDIEVNLEGDCEIRHL